LTSAPKRLRSRGDFHLLDYEESTLSYAIKVYLYKRNYTARQNHYYQV